MAGTEEIFCRHILALSDQLKPDLKRYSSIVFAVHFVGSEWKRAQSSHTERLQPGWSEEMTFSELAITV